MRLIHLIVTISIFTLSACATTSNQDTSTNLQARETKMQSIDQQNADASSMAASTIAPVTY